MNSNFSQRHFCTDISMFLKSNYIDDSFSAKSSRHFESRSSLHVSDLAALTIIILNWTKQKQCFNACISSVVCIRAGFIHAYIARDPGTARQRYIASGPPRHS